MARRPPSPGTIQQYERYLRRFSEAGVEDPEEWLDSLTPASAKIARAALRWADPDLTLRFREVQQKVPRALSRGDLAKIRMAAGPTDRMILDWLYYTLARVSEFIALRPEHVDTRTGMIHLPTTKTGAKERAIPLHPSLDPSVLPIGLARSTIEGRLRRLGHATGVPLHPHLLRSTGATHMLENGTDVTVVQQLLGHASIETTLRYLQITSDLKRQAISGLE